MNLSKNNDIHRAEGGLHKLYGFSTQHRYALLLLLLLFLAYYRTLSNGFIERYDDDVYITQNPAIAGGLTISGIKWALTTFSCSNWHPVTWLSHMLDISLYGLSPGGHHLTNLLLHAANVLLLFYLLRRLTGKDSNSFVVAALFAVHPLHVESVAWVAERKDLLSTFFGLTSLFCYAGYIRTNSRASYKAALAAATLSLMSKPMLVTLPFLLLLLDYWPFGRWQPLELVRDRQAQLLKMRLLVMEKLPFFALSAILCIVTLLAQKSGGAIYRANSLADSIPNVLAAYVTYLRKTAWPSDLAVFYPLNPIPTWRWLLSAVLLAFVTFLALRSLTRRPWFAFGWFWFIGTLVPVIGIVQVGSQALADRYTYLPIIGIFLIVVWGADEIAHKNRFAQKRLAGVTAALLIAFTGLSWNQTGYWKNSITLFRQTLKVTEGNWLVQNNLASELMVQEHEPWAEAQAHLNEAIRIRPDYEMALCNLGVIHYRLGKTDQAIQMFNRSIEKNPTYLPGYIELGELQARRGNFQGALRTFEQAMAIRPDDLTVRNDYARALARLGHFDQAIAVYRESMYLFPSSPPVYTEISLLYQHLGRLDEASAIQRQLSAINPDEGEKLGRLLAAEGSKR